MTTCQKPAEMPTEKGVQASVEMKSYRYYTVDTSELDEFTIELGMLRGQSEVFHSFTEQLPKNPEDFIDAASVETDREGNFVEPSPSSARLQREIFDAQETSRKGNKKVKKIYYQISVPEQEPNDKLFFSVRGGGGDERNEFQVYVHETFVDAKSVGLSSTTTSCVLLIVAGLFVALSFSF